MRYSKTCSPPLYSGTRQTTTNVAQSETHEPISIFHPEALRAESLIRNAWADTQLVAD